MERRVLRAVAALTLLAACSSSGDKAEPPSATLGTEPPRTTTTDPYAIPAVIDTAYVNRVLAGLDAANGEVTRLVVRTKSIPPEAIERLKALYVNKELLQLQIDSFQNELRAGLRGYRAEPGDFKTNVSELITGTRGCIFAQVSRDYSAVSVLPQPVVNEWIAIRPLQPSAEVDLRFNPTNWGFVYEGFQRDRTAPSSNPCSAT